MRLAVLLLCSTIALMAPLGATAHAGGTCVDLKEVDPVTGGREPSGACDSVPGCTTPFVWDDMGNGVQVWVCP